MFRDSGEVIRGRVWEANGGWEWRAEVTFRLEWGLREEFAVQGEG